MMNIENVKSEHLLTDENKSFDLYACTSSEEDDLITFNTKMKLDEDGEGLVGQLEIGRFKVEFTDGTTDEEKEKALLLIIDGFKEDKVFVDHLERFTADYIINLITMDDGSESLIFDEIKNIIGNNDVSRRRI